MHAPSLLSMVTNTTSRYVKFLWYSKDSSMCIWSDCAVWLVNRGMRSGGKVLSWFLVYSGPTLHSIAKRGRAQMESRNMHLDADILGFS